MGETPDIMKIIALIGVLAFTVEMTYHVYMECRYRRKLRQKAKTRSRTQFYIDIGPGEEIVVDGVPSTSNRKPPLRRPLQGRGPNNCVESGYCVV